MEWDGSYDDDVKELRRQLKQDAKNLRRQLEDEKYGNAPNIEEMLRRYKPPKGRSENIVDVFEAVGEAVINVFSFIMKPIFFIFILIVLWNVIDINVETTGEVNIEATAGTTAETITTRPTEAVSETPVPIPMDD